MNDERYDFAEYSKKKILKKKAHLEAIKAKLANEAFISGAPAEIIEQQRALQAILESELKELENV